MEKKKERQGFVIYFDIERPIEMLDDAQLGRFFRAIIQYAHYGTAPTFEDLLLKMAWSFIESALDRDKENYKDKVLKNTIKGIKSDFKNNYAPKHGIDPEDEDAMNEYIQRQLSTRVDYSQPTRIQKETKNKPFSSETKDKPIPSESQSTVERKKSPEMEFEDLRTSRIQDFIKHNP